MMNRGALLILSLAVMFEGCTDSKPPFSRKQFLSAKAECGAADAFIMKGAPDAIGFHGTSDYHDGQAKCLRQKLAGTDAIIVFIASPIAMRKHIKDAINRPDQEYTIE